MDISILAGVLAGNMGVRVVYSNAAPTFMVGKDDRGPVLIISTKLASIDGHQVDALNTMLRGALAHECVGHLRFTDMDRPVPEQPLLRALTNALEDVRIEFLAPTVYPGARRALREMVEELEARAFWAPQPEDGMGNALLMWLLRTLRAQVLQQPLREDWTQHFEQVVHAQFGEALCNQAMQLALTAHRQPDTAHVESLARDILALFVQNSPSSSPEASNDSGDEEDSDGEPAEANGADAQEEHGEDEDGAQAGSAGTQEDGSDSSDSSSDQSGAPSSGHPSGDNTPADPSSDGSSGDEAAGAQACAPQSPQDGEDGRDEDGCQENAGKGRGRGRLSLDLNAPTREVSPEEAVRQLVDQECDRSLASILTPSDWSQYRPDTPPVPVSALANRMREALRRSLYSLRDDEDDAPADRGRLHVPALPTALTGRSPAFLEDGQPAEGLDTHLTLLVDMSGSMHDLSDSVRDMMLAIGDAASAFEGDGMQWGLAYFNTQPMWVKRVQQPWARVRNAAYTHYAPTGNTLWPDCVAPLIVDAALSRRKRKVILTLTDGDLGDKHTAAIVLQSAQRHRVEMAFVGVRVRLDNYGIQADYTDNTPASVIKAVTGALQRVMRPSYA